MDDSDVWEPTPFRLGDKVRIVLGECPHPRRNELYDTNTKRLKNSKLETIGHNKAHMNQLGIIVSIDREQNTGHFYTVAFVAPVDTGKNADIGGQFAGVELVKEEFSISADRKKNILELCSLIGVAYPSTENT